MENIIHPNNILTIHLLNGQSRTRNCTHTAPPPGYSGIKCNYPAYADVYSKSTVYGDPKLANVIKTEILTYEEYLSLGNRKINRILIVGAILFLFLLLTAFIPAQ